MKAQPGRGPPDRIAPANGERSPNRTVHPLRVGLLGGFRVERIDIPRPVSGWQRRTAKRLTKLLATHPRHALHREQILEILWPDVELESALNSFGKALYAARRAFEPDLLPRESSAYLQLTDAMLALNTEHVVIDADHFQHLAESALRQGAVASTKPRLRSMAASCYQRTVTRIGARSAASSWRDSTSGCCWGWPTSCRSAAPTVSLRIACARCFSRTRSGKTCIAG